MKSLKKNIRLIGALITCLFACLIIYGFYSTLTQGNRWFSSSANTYMRQMKKNVIPGTIFDRNGRVLAGCDASGARRYHEDQAVRMSVVHAIGDHKNRVTYGAETFMAQYLYGFRVSVFERLIKAFQSIPISGDDLKLTLDAGLSKRIYQLFPAGKNGAVVVMNYKTGEVLALESFPSFDPVASTEADLRFHPDRPLWNRVTKWLSAPGSVFKIITTAAAIRNIPYTTEHTFVCNGLFSANNTVIRDAGHAIHHQLNLKRAFSVSCNVVYAQITTQLTDPVLRACAEDFGFGDHFLFRDFVVENSVYPGTNRTSREIAWTGIGQSTLLTTPLHMCMITSAVANNGVMMEPRLLLGANKADGSTVIETRSREYAKPLSPEESNLLSEFMADCVQNGTGKAAFIAEHRVCGKTGTAEKDNQMDTNAWFTGFIDEPSTPYAICIAVENAGSGGSVAAPIAKKVFEYLLANP